MYLSPYGNIIVLITLAHTVYLYEDSLSVQLEFPVKNLIGDTLKRHFYAREKLCKSVKTWFLKNSHNFVYVFKRFTQYCNVWHDKNLCNRRSTRIISINKTCTEKGYFMVGY
jgi:hypothetical protein